MLSIGLTGGIGCGKTTVSTLFNKQFNIPIIDADIIARQVVEPGQSGLTQLVNLLGPSILTEQGTLNRNDLKKRIFSNSELKLQVENILHPLIFSQMQKMSETIQDRPYIIFSIPLLFETHQAHLTDRVLVIDCLENQQISRVKQRDALEEADIKLIMASQVSRQYRLTHCDDVIDNSDADAEKLAEQIKKLHLFYLSLSTDQRIS
jgi:dephospho-CoA kinase